MWSSEQLSSVSVRLLSFTEKSNEGVSCGKSFQTGHEWTHDTFLFLISRNDSAAKRLDVTEVKSVRSSHKLTSLRSGTFLKADRVTTDEKMELRDHGLWPPASFSVFFLLFAFLTSSGELTSLCWCQFFFVYSTNTERCSRSALLRRISKRRGSNHRFEIEASLNLTWEVQISQRRSVISIWGMKLVRAHPGVSPLIPPMTCLKFSRFASQSESEPAGKANRSINKNTGGGGAPYLHSETALNRKDSHRPKPTQVEKRRRDVVLHLRLSLYRRFEMRIC